MKKLVLIPAFNEAKAVGKVIRSVKKSLKGADVLVVDDGSFDSTETVAQEAGAYVVRHIINRGLGGSIGTGLQFARERGYQAVVTMDADGQHNPADLKKVLNPIIQGAADLVIGTRMVNKFQVPLDRRIIIGVSNMLTFVIFGSFTSDSLSGFRAFSKKALEKIELKTQRMEVSNEIFSQIAKHGLRYAEVPIKVKYTSYSRSKGQSNMNAINVGLKLILRLAR